MRALTKLVVITGLVAWAPAGARECAFQASWGSSQMIPDQQNALPATSLSDATLRQVIRLSTGGNRFRVRLSNRFGQAPLRISHATIARSADNATARIVPGSLRPLHFSGKAAVAIPPGAEWLSDPVSLDGAPFADLAITLRIAQAPQVQTSHPGSRATSYTLKDADPAATDMFGAERTDHWFFLSAVEVQRCAQPGGIVTLGDSITDGFGVKANENTRWTDFFARRLGGKVAVINQGIGGNRVLLDGLGPNALARLDADVLSQSGVRHVILLEGINDLGVLGRDKPATTEQFSALVTDITSAYRQIIDRAHARGLKVHGGTILPFMSNSYYHPTAESERARQAINAWIRTPGHFDSVIDFDKALRDPARPDVMKAELDSGDGLHPGRLGYEAMAKAIPLERFR
ncbi:SGNH/GDSL hydrolase family protein [Sphingobium sp. CR28]|uniref:SGNH/GDSL hydrolase family protein n=1 Tax=Sphingobium sp. CR28 TaxID=3400272 RepID=UPI003FEFF1EE